MAKKLELLTESEASEIKYESAISYWARHPHIRDADGALVFTADPDGRDNWRAFAVTTAQIQRAALGLLCARDAGGQAIVNNDILSSIATREIDSVAGDCVIQFAAFGKILFG